MGTKGDFLILFKRSFTFKKLNGQKHNGMHTCTSSTPWCAIVREKQSAYPLHWGKPASKFKTLIMIFSNNVSGYESSQYWPPIDCDTEFTTYN